MTATAVERKWLTTDEVAESLGFGNSKTKLLIAKGEIRSVKDGHHRHVLPQWVDDYIERKIRESNDG